jgi:hypothetical protein
MKILRRLLGPFVVLAAIGCAICLVLHLAALMGAASSGNSILALVAGVFVVGFPAIVMSNEMAPRLVNPVRHWKLTTEGAPQWMRIGAVVLMFYAIATFFTMATQHSEADSIEGHMRPWELQMFSALFMAMYFWALTTMYAAKRQQDTGYVRLCPNGHQVSPAAQYCERCGTAVQ